MIVIALEIDTCTNISTAQFITWRDVGYEILRIEDPCVNEYLRALRALYSDGGVLWAQFRAKDSLRFRQAVLADTRGARQGVADFLDAPEVARAFPELRIESPIALDFEIHYHGPLSFEGALGDLLLFGGAGTRFPGSVDEARQLARSFCDVVTPQRRDTQCFISSISNAWSKWFKQIAWDSTFLCCDHRAMTWTLLCGTDTD